MVEGVGFEPTVPMKVRRFSRPVHSAALSPLRIGSQAWTRTRDIRINSPVFYQLNYLGTNWSRYRDSNSDALVGNEEGYPYIIPALLLRNWCRRPDLNWRPTDYKSVALPTVLLRHIII